jgi:hypothetical protein
MPVLDHAIAERATVRHNTKLGNGKTHLLRNAPFCLDLIRHDAQRQRFHLRLSFGLDPAVCENPRKALDLGDPAAVFFAIKHDFEFH